MIVQFRRIKKILEEKTASQSFAQELEKLMFPLQTISQHISYIILRIPPYLKWYIYCSKKKEELKKQGGIYEKRQNYQSPIYRYSPAVAGVVFRQISGKSQHDHPSNQRRKSCPV